MKTMIKVMAMALLAVIMCTVLASCGNTISGKYTGKGGALDAITYTYEFSGKKVTLKVVTPSLIGDDNIRLQEGTYEIKDDMIIFTWESNTGDGTEVGTGPYTYASGDGFIMIDGDKLDKE